VASRGPLLAHISVASLVYVEHDILGGAKANNPMNNSRPFVWYELMTTDIDSARSFYSEVFGWAAEDASVHGMPYILFRDEHESCSGAMWLSEGDRERGMTPNWVGYVGTRDVNTAVQRIQDSGGQLYVPPTEIPNVSRFAVVTDSQMAQIGLLRWLLPQKEEWRERGPVGWHELFTEDPKQALEFYSVQFGWTAATAFELDEIGTYQLFSVGGELVGAMLRKVAPSPPFWLFYFLVDDAGAAAKMVEAAGGQLLDGPLAGPGSSWIVHCTDREGAMFALMGKGSGADFSDEVHAKWSSTWQGRSLGGKVRFVMR
jgi:predicted enzyme related to lactoylglutathione lyase